MPAGPTLVPAVEILPDDETYHNHAMRRNTVVVKTLSLFGLGLLSAANFAQSGSGVYVNVKDASGRLLSDVRLTLMAPSGEPYRAYTANSDRLGAANFRPSQTGRFTLVATKDNYQVQVKDINVSYNRPVSVELRMTQSSSRKILVAVRSQDTNDSINDAKVLVQTGGSRDQQYSVRSGFVTIPVSSSGRYTIHVSHPDFDPGTAIVQTRSQGDQFSIVTLRRNSQQRTVVVKAIESGSRTPISRARVTFESGSDRRTSTTDSNGNVSVKLNQRTTYRVTIESNGHQTYTDQIDLQRPDTSILNRTYQLRRGEGNGGPGNGNQRGAKLNGDIRMKTGRVKAGEIATADIGVFYTDSQIERMTASVSVKVTDPNGRTVATSDYRQDLDLNGTSRRLVDIRTTVPGAYYVRVTATGNSMQTWTSEKKFDVDRGQAGPVKSEGIYGGTIDLINLSGEKRAHTVSIKISKKNGNLYDVVGSLGPGRFEGFHIEFKGTYDVSRKNLDTVGNVVDEDGKRWDVRMTGTINQAGRLAVKISLRARDNSYNRTATAEFFKQ